MYKIQTLNKISNKGLNIFDRESYEIAGEIVNPDAVLVRSADMLNADIPASVKSIARAGAGVNNIPIAKCTDRGIAVFNTPGANANAVKELVIAGMLLSARKIVDGIVWTRAQTGKGDELHPLVEKSKSTYGGTEIKGKKLGIIGLGAIGVMVANDALAMGMEVIGYDPYITIDNAWGMDHRVQ
ncbi:MAG TPA: NAD(P)-dependent oxidoreductase, partial [Spirochaetota bacterium]|nr:NAD(P)-dependent oxidoreductase [Spirochaetota bacterium]